MAASSASMAASKLLNPRNTALQTLIRRHLLHPSAAVSLQPTSTCPAHPLKLFHPENVSPDSPDGLTSAMNPSFYVSESPLNFPSPFGFHVMQIKAAGVGDDNDDDEDEDNGNDDDDDNDEDNGNDDDDEDNGNDDDDEDNGNDDDDDDEDNGNGDEDEDEDNDDDGGDEDEDNDDDDEDDDENGYGGRA